MSLLERAKRLFRTTQDQIVTALEELEDGVKFQTDQWERPDLVNGYGGGGVSRLLQNGAIFEQAGVNFSAVHGHLPIEMGVKLLADQSISEPVPFIATGISLVIHPLSPLIPTTHANYRFLQVGSKQWFGGGGDLTPYVLFDEDAKHFHRVLKGECDRFNSDFYPRFKNWCDEYFYLPHRHEARGIGGIFFDYLGRETTEPDFFEKTYDFVATLCSTWVDTYLPIVKRRKSMSWSEEQRQFQLQRRGRYVEFNLLYDRGTKFGLSTGGRIQSIFMSLPPLAAWDPHEAGSVDLNTDAGRLLQVLRQPREWV